jgi:hypothetical protein
MANNNGSLVKAFGVIGSVLGVIGLTIGLATMLGPGKDVARHEAQLLDTTVTLTSHGSKIAVLEATYADIKAALVRIEAKVERGTP